MTAKAMIPELRAQVTEALALSIPKHCERTLAA